MNPIIIRKRLHFLLVPSCFCFTLMIRSIRNAFITGIIAILPLGVTLFVIGLLLDKLGTPASSFFFQNVDPAWKESELLVFLMESVSVVAVFALITLLGYFSRFFLGRILLNIFERLLHNVPFINTVYGTVRQIVNTFSEQKNAVFQEVVLSSTHAKNAT